MNPQDDPEARIRDLERPLSDVAAASEMGTAPTGPTAAQPGPFTAQPGPFGAQPGPFGAQLNPYAAQAGPYAPPPILPPGSYGGPYPPAAPMKTAGLRGCWIALAVFAVVAIAVVVGVAFFGARIFSSHSSVVSFPSVRPSISRGNPVNTPSSQPGNSAPGGASTATAPPGGNLNITGVSENKTIVCNDAAVTITGLTNTIVLTGHCKSVTVLGSKNVVTLDTADAIDASGIENQVTFHSGSPSVQNTGISNTVQQG